MSKFEASDVGEAGIHPVLGEAWHPTRWGSTDEMGNGNLLTAKKVLEAVSLIKTGQTVKLGFPYHSNMPMAEGRSFQLRMPAGPTSGPEGRDNQSIWNDDFLAATIGQVGTHMDGLGHFGCQCGVFGDNRRAQFYNGQRLSDMLGAYGLKSLGIEKAPPFVTRGILFDVVKLKGRLLQPGEEITVDDLKACLELQGLPDASIGSGDAVLINTGHVQRPFRDSKEYHQGCPGIGLDAARWLSAFEPSVIGADNFSVEVAPSPDPALSFPCHQHLITKCGIYMHENMKLDDIARVGVYEFAYIFVPVPIVGATGSIGTPLAIL
jgi:kynurenine formamidase